jgi:hypothetical protein
MCCFVLFMLA